MLKNIWNDSVKAYQFFSLSRKGGVLLLGIYLAKSGWSLESIGYWEGLLFGVALLGSFWLEAWIKSLLTVVLDEHGNFYSVFRWIVKRVILFSFVMGALWYFGAPVLEWLLLPYVPPSWLSTFILFAVFWLPTLVLPSYFLVLKKAPSLWILSIYYLLAFPFCFILADQRFSLPYQSIYGLYVWLAPLLLLLLVELFRRRPGSQLRNTSGLWTRWRTLGLYSILAIVAPLVDAWLVQLWYPDPATFAIFRYGARELPLIGTLAAGLSTAMIPVFAKDWNSSLAELKKRTQRLITWLYPLVLLLLIMAPYLYIAVFSWDFMSSSYIFQIYLLLVVSQLMIVQPVILSKGKERWLVEAAVGELIVNIGGSLLLGYFFGIPGIAWATVIAFLYEKLFLVIRIKKHFGTPLFSYYPRLGVIMSIILLAVYFINNQLLTSW